MAKYTVTYSCDHVGTVQLIGPHRTREWRLEKLAGQLCPACYAAHLREERAKRSAESADANAEAGLPALQGSPKQIAWAETIRKAVLDRVEAELERAEAFSEGEIIVPFQRIVLRTDGPELQQALDWLNAQPSAHWWIEHRGEHVPQLLALAVEAARKAEPAAQAAAEAAKAAEAEALAEATLRPEAPLTETVAEIRASSEGGRVEIRFPEKRDDFRQVVKHELGCEWAGDRWVRTLTKWAGKPRDRAAEAGHRLLAAGFVVRILDPEVRALAVAGTYEPECTRWVKVRTEAPHKGWFSLSWGERNERLYAAARRLKGSRYEKGAVLVPPEHYEQVTDFAELNAFRLSEAARAAAETARTVRERALGVRVEAPERTAPPVVGAKPPVLPVPDHVDVAAELRD